MVRPPLSRNVSGWGYEIRRVSNWDTDPDSWHQERGSWVTKGVPGIADGGQSLRGRLCGKWDRGTALLAGKRKETLPACGGNASCWGYQVLT